MENEDDAQDFAEVLRRGIMKNYPPGAVRDKLLAWVDALPLVLRKIASRGNRDERIFVVKPAKDGFGVHAIKFAAATSQSRFWEAERCG